MSGEERRQGILAIMNDSNVPVSGTELAGRFGVSRQVIVQDIALLRAMDKDIISTKKGYIFNSMKAKQDNTTDKQEVYTRTFKVIHEDSDVEKELTLIVDLGGRVEDVFVYHKVYGVVKAELHIATRRDIENYMQELKNGRSSLLKNVTSGYHYHTVVAGSELLLDVIQEKLAQYGFLAKLQEYEPVDFWKNKA